MNLGQFSTKVTLRSLILIVNLCLLAGFSSVHAEPWKASELLEHPLVGKLWSLETESWQEPDQWLQERPKASWLLLGEQHDHPDHQRLAEIWLGHLAEQGRLGVLALEMLQTPQQAALDAAWGQGVEDAAELAWPEQGWDWAVYAELVQAGLLHSRRVLAIDLPRDQQLRAYREGAARPALSESQAAALDELLYEGHCQLLPRERLSQMRQVQLARDQAMAMAMSQAAAHDGVNLLLAGSVHVRQDVGIPRWLPAEVEVVSVLLQQVVADKKEPEAYLPEPVDGLRAFDYIFFTPAIPPVDYCEALRGSGAD